MAEPFLSDIRIKSFNFPPKAWALSNGQLLPIAQNQALFSLLGTTYGGNGQTNFALPNLRGLVSVDHDSDFTLGQIGGAETHTLVSANVPQPNVTAQALDSDEPYLATNFFIGA